MEPCHITGTVIMEAFKSIYFIEITSSGSNSPPHPDKVQIAHTLEGFLHQMSYYPSTEKGKIPGVSPAYGGGGIVEGSN